MYNERNSSIWLCSDRTEKECLSRNLFGAKNDSLLKRVRAGDICFLYNYETSVLFGVFVAVSDPGWDLEPKAWGGQFPYQIRVKLVTAERTGANGERVFREIGLKMTETKAGFRIPAHPVYGSDVTRKLLSYFPALATDKIPAQQVSVGYQPKEGFESVAGLDDVKAFIRERMIEPFRNLRLAEKYRLRVGGGLLLYGPPGTGKSLIAKAAAKEIDAEFIEISPSVVRGFPGEPEQQLERIFQQAFQKPRVVIFIDEADALLAARERGLSSSVMQRIIPTFLRLFTKVSEQNAPVFIIGATNKPDNLDRAFLRPGRFDMRLKVSLPDQQARVELLGLALANRPLSEELRDSETLEQLAQKLDGWTGADIQLLIDRVAQKVFSKQLRGKPDLGKDPDEEINDKDLLPLTLKDILDGIEQELARPSVLKEQVEEIEKWEATVGAL